MAAQTRSMVYFSVSDDVKGTIGKIASVSGTSEGDVYLKALGVSKIDNDTLKQRLDDMKMTALAEYMDVDPDEMKKFIEARRQKNSAQNKDSDTPAGKNQK